MKKLFSRFLVVVLLLVCRPHLQAQGVGVSYDAELQITPAGQTNQLNLLELTADYAMNERITLSAATISVAKTRKESLLGDLQTFSNLEADNLPLVLTVAGFDWSINDRHSLFVGVRGVSEDYFASPVTSLFTNSSCGIFPTLSCNMPMANYPTASLSLHYSYASEPFSLMASLYNGVGYTGFVGRENVWRFAPKSDGIFAIAQGAYSHEESQYFVGACIHSGVNGDFDAQQVVWGYAEQRISPRCSLIADYSHAFGKDCECRDFVGIGAQYTFSKSTLGFFADYARFEGETEQANEITYKYEISPMVSVQAAYHVIGNDTWRSVGLIRLSIHL